MLLVHSIGAVLLLRLLDDQGGEGTLLEHLQDLGAAVGVELLVGDALDELGVVLEDGVESALQLNSLQSTLMFFSLRMLR